jgi:rhodanese-related sulfurtransferase
LECTQPRPSFPRHRRRWPLQIGSGSREKAQRRPPDSEGANRPLTTNRVTVYVRTKHHYPQGEADGIGLFGGATAWTGVSEKTLKRRGDTDYEKIYLFPNSRAGYYPGAKMIGLKVIFRKSDGKLLGAQALGEDGPAVDKRISALAAFLQMGATIYDLEEAELCYAPQFGSAKDPVNFAGMVAGNILRGDMPVSHWESVDGAYLLDVRNPPELVLESVPAAVNIPLPQLRSRLGELPKDREIKVICRSAQRAHYATRTLLQHGFTASTPSGGMLARAMKEIAETK